MQVIFDRKSQLASGKILEENKYYQKLNVIRTSDIYGMR